MAEQPFFSILITTYNRPLLVKNAIQTLCAQSFKDFNVCVLDNGSVESIEQEARLFLGDKLHSYVRLPQNVRLGISDIMQNCILKLGGQYLLWLADDDGLVPSALERIFKIVKTTKAKILATNFSYYIHPVTDKTDNFHNSVRLLPFSGKIHRYDPFNVVTQSLSCWNIGKVQRNVEKTPLCLPSATWISRELALESIRDTGFLFGTPLGDVGYLASTLRTDKVFYYDMPLSIIGTAATRDWDGTKKGRRFHWNVFKSSLQLVPCKAISFINVGVESHLKVIEKSRAKLNGYSTVLTSGYYTRHINEIIGDNPWNKQTFDDILEWYKVCVRLPFRMKILVALEILHSLFTPLFVFIRIMGGKAKRIFIKNKKSKKIINYKDDKAFCDIATCAMWIENKLPSTLSELIYD